MSAADDPMPVFVIKAKDNVAPGGVEDYIGRLEEHGLHHQAEQARAALIEMEDWRERNRDLCKWPDHEHVPAGQPGSGSETA